MMFWPRGKIIGAAAQACRGNEFDRFGWLPRGMAARDPIEDRRRPRRILPRDI
jgi:hypothetical protein